MLDTDYTWFTPQKTQEYRTAPSVDEPNPVVLQPVMGDGEDHPPLSSPEPDSQAVRQNDLHFHTQAPPMMDESQFKRNQTTLKKAGAPTNRDTQEYEWEPTTQKPMEITSQKRPPTTEAEQEESEEVFEWGESPTRSAHFTKKVLSLFQLD